MMCYLLALPIWELRPACLCLLAISTTSPGERPGEYHPVICLRLLTVCSEWRERSVEGARHKTAVF